MPGLSFARVSTLAIAALLLPAGADIISDITAPVSDEFSALQIKVEKFWKPVMRAADDVKMDTHLQLYADTEAVIKSLPAENDYVRQALTEALAHLKSADETVFKQALQASRVANEKLDAPCDFSGSAFSFFRGGQNFIKSAVSRLVGGRYSDKLVEHVGQRQADIIPVLRGTADVTGNVLSDCRLAQKRSFDVGKYDIYNSGVPKTPKNAEDIADRLVEAAGETRRRFTKSITSIVDGIARDEKEKQEEPAAVVTKASLQSLHSTIAKAEASFVQKRESLSPFGTEKLREDPQLDKPRPLMIGSDLCDSCTEQLINL